MNKIHKSFLFVDVFIYIIFLLKNSTCYVTLNFITWINSFSMSISQSLCHACDVCLCVLMCMHERIWL